MNNVRRKEIDAIRARLSDIKSQIESIAEDIRNVEAAEQDAFDNKPESLQESEKGQQSQEAIDNLGNVASDLESIDIESMLTYLEEAQQ